MSDVDQVTITPEQKHPLIHKRKFLLTWLTAFILILVLIFSVYWFSVARFYEETDNAYVNGNIIPVTAQTAGTIIAIKADDTQFVKTGQVLVELDPIDSYVALEQAKANLAQALRSTQQLFINNAGLQAGINKNKASLDKARKDLTLRQEAISFGAVSKEELNHAQITLKSANASMVQAHSALLSNQALTENTTLQQHPSVLLAAAKYRQAYIDYKRTKICAPIAGEISKRTAQIGRHITAGTQLMALVPLDQIWIDANFKEKQVRNMRINQPVTLFSDLYGTAVKYHGKIMGFSAGTGSAFALLPAQNATGNWIKVVQRLPVRIALDPKELTTHPLRIGLSMHATVNTHDRSGYFIGSTPQVTEYKTMIYDSLAEEADVEITNIITEYIQNTPVLRIDQQMGKKHEEK